MKKKNGKGAEPRYEVIGHETRIMRRELDEEERATIERGLRDSYAEERKLKLEFRSFRKFALPKVEAVLDPEADEDLEESVTLDLDEDDGRKMEEARALNDEIERRRKIAAARVAVIKAERRAALDRVVNGYEYRAVEVDIEADNEALTVRYVDPTSGEVIDTRGMTAAERQMALPDELPAGGAPAAVS